MWKQQFFIEGRYYGEVQRVRNQTSDLLPLGDAYFCRVCGSLWAVLPVTQQPFMVHTLPCPKHGPSLFGPGGSIWRGWDEDFNHSLPLTVAKREFHLHIAHLERSQEYEKQETNE